MRKSSSIIDFFDLEAPYVTEFRRLLHRVLTPNGEQELKSILLTSAMLSEGKSTICSFLALIAASKRGMKTLIVDTDMRRPAIHRFFQLPSQPGLSEILTDAVNPTDVIRKTSMENLHVLTAGRRHDNPTEIFDPEAIGNLINDFKFYYDLILVDCAPLLPVSDPMLLAPKMDGVIMVIKAGATQKEVVLRALGILDPRRSRVLGIALNNINHSLPYYYDSNYYYYYGENRRPRKPRTSGKGAATGPSGKDGESGSRNNERTGGKEAPRDNLTRSN